jgi:hypothetical protein
VQHASGGLGAATLQQADIVPDQLHMQ